MIDKLIKKIDGKFPFELLDNGNHLVINGDCLEVMELMDDKSIDLVLTDPPYGINCDGGSYGFGNSPKNYDKKNWDKLIPKKEIFDYMFKTSTNQIIFGGNYFTDFLKPTKSWIVWDKIGELQLNNPFSECELIWTSFIKTTKKYTFLQQGFIKQDKEERIHPTQKPAGLFCKILQDYSNDNDLILDTFAGSFTTTIACIRTNRKSICIELDEDYYKAGVHRVKEELRQGRFNF